MTSIVPWFGGRRGGGLDSWFGSTDNWDPFSLGTSWGQGDRGDEVTAIANAQVDWRETDTAHVFRVDLPGVGKGDVKVQVEDNHILQISGERVKEVEDKNDKWHRVERRRGSFLRSFRLPENVKFEEITCQMDDGVLTIVLPKQQQQKAKNVKRIDVA